jgi:uncharacterized membrane protein
MNFENNKILGGVGGILMFLGFVPYTYGILGLVGAILVVIAMKGFADYYKEAGIFENTLYAIILAIVGVVAFVGIAFVALVDFFASLGITLGINTYANWATQVSSIDWANVGIMNDLFKFAGFILLDLVVLFVFVLVTAIMLRKSLKLMSAKTGVGLFGTTGTVLLIGAVLTIVAFGLFLVWISALLLAIAFFQIKQPSSSTANVQPPPPMQTNPSTA